MENQNSPILILGTGAMASLFAAHLAASGSKVRMLGTWVEGIEAINQNGVRLIGLDGDEQSYPAEATDDPLECAGSEFAIVLVKSYQIKRVAQQLSVCLSEDGLALTLQNGLGNDTALAEVLGAQRVAAGVTTFGATLVEPGLVRYGGEGAISLGNNKRVDSLAEVLIKAGFVVELVENTDSLVWGKLVINAAINPLTALLKVPNGELIANPTARTLMGLVAQETKRVSSATGIDLPYQDAVAVVESVAQKTASNLSSMLKDVMRNSPTEIDAINGAVVRVGEAINVPVEINRTLWLLVKAMIAKSEFAERDMVA
jgi:2-dehydropantoate 2-reductase